MAIVVELLPGTEARLRAQAERQGVTAESLAARLIDSQVGSEDAEQWVAELDALIASLPRREHPLPDSAVSRSAFYSEPAPRSGDGPIADDEGPRLAAIDAACGALAGTGLSSAGLGRVE